jgi:hypothetical protein
MMKRMGVYARSLALAGALVLVPLQAVSASSTVSQRVTCPGRPALSAQVLGQPSTSRRPEVTFRAQGQKYSDAKITLAVADSTCLGLGWNVTLQAASVSFSGKNGSRLTPRDLSVIALETPRAVPGSQPVNGQSGPVRVQQIGSLDRTRKVVKASPRFGIGSYTQGITLRMSFPDTKARGTYTATLVVTTSTGPGV